MKGSGISNFDKVKHLEECLSRKRKSLRLLNNAHHTALARILQQELEIERLKHQIWSYEYAKELKQFKKNNRG